MFKRILVPTDGTELCSLALDTALGLAGLADGTIVGVHACPVAAPARPDTIDPAQAAWREEHERQGRDALAYVRRRAREAGVACETVLVRGVAPHDAVERTARERGCDLVVMAAHARRGLRMRLLGGETGAVLAQGTVPVLVVR